jgi:hypothetical protein
MADASKPILVAVSTDAIFGDQMAAIHGNADAVSP